MSQRRQQGFTLVEMMVTLSLLASLAAASLPLIEKQAQRNKEEQLQQALRQIRQALDRYQHASQQGLIEKRSDESGYPPTLQALTDGVVDKTSPNQRKIYFLRRIPRDPMCDCAGKADHESWRIRSSNSEPGNFTRKGDIYDVASFSEARGLNGVPYAQW
ncbi:type II secretion system GspH family protein [Erwiniaceae bacterium BAC15a-03b]|uniref:Type II secretion system GspH family protein n=1 Tax=Winslowiella arboricola TaxID=2978220 RepID=A0A9J6PW68_9GAMM|nr:type II secretion system protein [Winslowiella arboricola]MCU5772721.1 type II secretion system GspH family protein [Winslowiella arboricola]MCU5778271.1 type II secretion system GspH family protein [Winslowiella arboricola]